MFKAITSLLGRPRTLNAELELDHVEISSQYIIVGLEVKWSNMTAEPLDIRSVMIKVYHQGKKAEPVQLIYNGRFVRIPYQKAITKIAGATSFPVAAGSTQVECLRFLTYELPDLNSGTYAAELHSSVEAGTYVHDFDLKVVPQLKHRVAAPEPERGQTAGLSSIYSRALRIGDH